MDGDLRRADLHLERHPTVPFDGDGTETACASRAAKINRRADHQLKAAPS
jgi:hypothetical protein